MNEIWIPIKTPTNGEYISAAIDKIVVTADSVQTDEHYNSTMKMILNFEKQHGIVELTKHLIEFLNNTYIKNKE